MKSNRATHFLLLVLTAGLVHFSCRPASYEIVRFKKNKKVNTSGNPNQVAPPDSRTENPTTKPAVPSNALPTARVEVMLKGVSVTTVRVGDPVSIRPSLDTVDPDDINVSPCINPGIIRADYDIATTDAKSASRSHGCEPLAVPHTFNQPGRIEIEMIVTSNEDEKAIASMTLMVVGANDKITGDGGFTISANPMVASKGEDVAFDGKCQTVKKNTITWDFGDGQKGEGKTTKHPYATEGQFKVTATCTDEDGKEMTAVVTICVIGIKITIPGVPVNPGDDSGSGTDATDGSDTSDTGVSDTDGTDAPDGNDTGDTDGNGDASDGGTDSYDPGQKPGQQQPGQKPGQSPALPPSPPSYDPGTSLPY